MPVPFPTLERNLVKPPYPYCLNKDSPQAVGLVAWYPFGVGLDARDMGPIQRYHLAPAGSPTFVMDKQFGRVADVLTSSSQRFNATLTKVTGPPCTLTAWHNPDNTTDTGWLVEVYSSTNVARYMVLMKRTGGDMRGRQQGATATVTVDTTSAYTVGSWNFAAAIFGADNATAIKAHGNARVSSTTDSGTKTLDGLSIAAEMFSTPRAYYGGLIGDVRVYNRALSDAELNLQYYADTRFDLYYPIGRKVYSFPTGGGPVTVNPPSAVLDLDNDSSIATILGLLPSAQLDLTGVVPTGRLTALASAANLDLNGVAPAIRVAAQAISAVLDLDNDLPTGRVTVQGGSAGLDLIANPPTVSGNVVVTCDPAILNLEGVSPVLRLTANLISAVTNLIADALTGRVTSVATSPSVDLTGVAPTARISVNPVGADLDLVANPPTILGEIVVTCDTAILNLMAGAVTVVSAIFGLSAWKVPGEPRGWVVPSEPKGFTFE